MTFIQSIVFVKKNEKKIDLTQTFFQLKIQIQTNEVQAYIVIKSKHR